MALHEDGDEKESSEEESSEDEELKLSNSLNHEEEDVEEMRGFRILNYHTTSPEERANIGNIEEKITSYKANFPRFFLHYDSKRVNTIKLITS